MGRRIRRALAGADEPVPRLRETLLRTIALGSTGNLNERMNSLPAQIFADVGQAQDRLVQRAWGAALTLVTLILILNVLARLSQRRSRAT